MPLSKTTLKARASINQNHTFDKYCCNACLASGKACMCQTPEAAALYLIKILHPVSPSLPLTVSTHNLVF